MPIKHLLKTHRKWGMFLVLCIFIFAAARWQFNFNLPTPLPSTPTPPAPSSPTLIPTSTDESVLDTPDLTLGLPIKAMLDDAGGCEDHTLHSNALGMDLWFAIYLPPDYGNVGNTKRYPVVYLLSGLGGNYREWAYDYNLCWQVQQMINTREIPPLIVVMPSGNPNNPQTGYGGYWINHAPKGFTCPDAVAGLNVSDGRRWGDYVWHDLVNVIDANFRTLPQASSRAIGGMSAGGQAALTHALMHPDIFGAVGSHSASHRRADCSVAFMGTPDYYKQFDPFELAQEPSATAHLAIWIDDGDRSVWYPDNEAFNNLLTVLDVPHEWRIYPGEHNPPYWQDHLAEYMRWYAAHLVKE